jgi:hypothetical protein
MLLAILTFLSCDKPCEEVDDLVGSITATKGLTPSRCRLAAGCPVGLGVIIICFKGDYGRALAG